MRLLVAKVWLLLAEVWLPLATVWLLLAEVWLLLATTASPLVTMRLRVPQDERQRSSWDPSTSFVETSVPSPTT